jgi:hypothetical protein
MGNPVKARRVFSFKNIKRIDRFTAEAQLAPAPLPPAAGKPPGHVKEIPRFSIVPCPLALRPRFSEPGLTYIFIGGV